MKFPHNPHKITGLLFLLAAILILPFWYILLFVAEPSNVPVFENAAATLRYLFSAENPALPYVYWHAFAPLAIVVFSGSYLFGVSHSKQRATILLTLSLALGVSAFFFSNLAIVFLFFYLAIGLICPYQALAVKNYDH